MRAALYDRYGAPDVLYEGDVPTPTLIPGEILVRVHAASVNSIDTIVRAGKLRLFTGGKFPQRTALDFAGEIFALGAKTSGFQVGNRVWGVLPRGKCGSAAGSCKAPTGRTLADTRGKRRRRGGSSPTRARSWSKRDRIGEFCESRVCEGIWGGSRPSTMQLRHHANSANLM
jgi:Zn-dependent alcohol dehydrogenase